MLKKIAEHPNTCLFFILILAFGLRLINLGEPYWFDEVLSMGIVKQYHNDIGGMINYLNTIEIHPPFYYLLLNYWTNLVGFGQFGVRLISVAFGLGVVALTYLVGKVIFDDKKIGLLAAFIIAVLPVQIEFSQEARPYIIFCFFGLLAAISLWQYLEIKNKAYLFFYVLANLVGLYLHYSFIFAAAALALYWLIIILIGGSRPSLGKKIIIWLLAHLAIFIGFYWQLVSMFYKMSLSEHLIYGLSRMFELSRPFSLLRNYDFLKLSLHQLIWVSKHVSVANVEIFAIFIFKVLFFIFTGYLIFQLVKVERTPGGKKYRPIFFAVWLVFAPIIFYSFSPYSISYTIIIERHVIISSVFMAIILAYVITSLELKKGLLLLVLFLVSIMNFTILVLGNDAVWDVFHRMPVIADSINKNYKAGDIVFILGAFWRTDLNYYLRDDISVYGLYPANLYDNRDFLASRLTLGLGENEYQFRNDKNKGEADKLDVKLKMHYLVESRNVKRIWLVLLEKDTLIHDWLNKNNWSKGMDSLGPLMPVELYKRRD